MKIKMKFRFIVVELSALSALVAGWELDGRCYHWICDREESPRWDANTLKWNDQMCDCLSGECKKQGGKKRGLRAQFLQQESHSTDHFETVDDAISEKEFEEIREELDEFDEMLEEAFYEIEQGSDEFDKVLQQDSSESDKAFYEDDELAFDYLKVGEFESSNQGKIGRVLNKKKRKQQKKKEAEAKRQREREQKRAEQERQRIEQAKRQEEERRRQDQLRTIGRKPPQGVKVKLHWHKWSCWQYEMIPRYWCVYAHKMPGSNAYKVYLDNCNKNMNSMGWDFQPVSMKSKRNLVSNNDTSSVLENPIDNIPMTNNTFQIRNTAHNLCMSASENKKREHFYEIKLRPCDESNSHQIFLIDKGKDIWGDTMCSGGMDSCFEIHPVDDLESCLDNPHHPKSGERFGMKPCKKPRGRGHQTHHFEIASGV